MSRVGSGQEGFNLTGRARSGHEVFKISRVGLAQVKTSQFFAARARSADPTRPDPTRKV